MFITFLFVFKIITFISETSAFETDGNRVTNLRAGRVAAVGYVNSCS